MKTGVLTRGRHSVRLSDQAAKVLEILVEHGGELVSRKELCDQLWPDVTVNESDQGINNIVSRLRGHLRDSSQKPIYIETIPKRGYRFLAQIQEVQPEQSSSAEEVAELPSLSPAPNLAEEPIVTSPEGVPAEKAAQTTQARSPRLYWVWGVACVIGLLLAGTSLVLLRARTTKPGHRSTALAIAPFQVAVKDGSTEQVAESLRMDLTDSLSRMPGLLIRASNSFSGLPADADQRAAYAAQLHVDEVLYVHLTHKGEKYLMDMELVGNPSQTHLASWHYEAVSSQLDSVLQRARDDIFSASRGNGASKPAHGGTNNPEAYEIYLHARFHAHQRLPDSLKLAIQEYQQAIALDSEFASAYAGLADAYVANGEYAASGQMQAYLLGQEAVQHALHLDPSLAEAHALLGYLLFRKDWNFVEGEAQMREAIRLDGAKANYHLGLSVMLNDQRRFAEAAHEIEAAKEDDPFWAAVYVDEAYLEANLHQFNKLAQTVETLISLKPDWSGSYDQRAWSYWLSGHYEEAIAEWRRMALMDHDTQRIALEDRGIDAFRKGGVKAYAKLRYEASISGTKYQHAEWDFKPAEWAAYMGDQDLTIRILSDMLSKHDIDCLEMAINPAYAPLHRDPRYLKLLAKIGLPAA